MKLAFAGAALAACLALATPAYATDLIADGIHYNLNENLISANGLTAFFTLTIAGENTAADTEGGVAAGRSGINAFALNLPAAGATAGAVTSTTGFTAPNWSFVPGGLSSTGCDGSGNFFCFDNLGIPPIPSGSLSGPLSINFNVTSTVAGAWLAYSPAFKIDWVGTAHNYDLVSLHIPDNIVGCPDCVINPVIADAPEPATWITMILGFAFVGSIMRRKQPTVATRVRFA